jgi:hypothetical protein
MGADKGGDAIGMAAHVGGKSTFQKQWASRGGDQLRSGKHKLWHAGMVTGWGWTSGRFRLWPGTVALGRAYSTVEISFPKFSK